MAENGVRGRYSYIDMMRFLAANLVIILHANCYYFIDTYAGRSMWWVAGFINELTRCGVPLFFMISGYLLLRSPATANIKEFYKRRLPKFAIPFLVWDIVYYCFYRIRAGVTVFSTDFFKELFGSGSAYHLWFMYALLLLYLAMPFVKKVLDSCSPKAQTLFFLLVIFQTTIKPLFNVILQNRLYIFLSEDGVVGYLGYVVIGYILGSRTFSKKAVGIAAAVGVASWLLFAYLNCTAALSGRGYIFNFGYTVNHYIEAGALFIVIKNFSWKKLEGPLGLLSELCLPVYFVHVLIMELVMPHLQSLSLSVFCLVLYLITAVLSFAFALVLRYVKKLLVRGISRVSAK